VATKPVREGPSRLSRWLRTIARALLLAFVFGFGIGTWLRCEAEKAATKSIPYLGERTTSDASDRPA
jgi:hypothetical protein